jgi:2-polyprenyl-3-methyl-5-hydroxy-6-metoxy-1,4-benzoquinol methylase
MYFFDNFPEFVNLDSRKDRNAVPLSAETLSKRHEVTLPAELIKDASVLDLGCCLGASGHWCLSNGARHYTGIDIQQSMIDKANSIFSKYWTSDQYNIFTQDITDFLTTTTQKFDVVVMFGVLHSFVDTYTILKNVTKVCNKFLIIDTGYPRGMTTDDSAILYISKYCQINSDDPGVAFEGVGIRPSPEGLRVLLGTLGFVDKENLLYPSPLLDSSINDAYNKPVVREGSGSTRPTRYLIRFSKTNKTTPLLKDVIINNDKKSTVPMLSVEKSVSVDPWVFDDNVANRFQSEALKHIPDYERVIALCQQYVKQIYNTRKDIKILDVGSALGYTMDKFISDGYVNVYGVESSSSMLNNSKYPDFTIHSSILPEGPWNVILANWTLHFIQDRKNYIQEMYNNLAEGGILIISDKMSHSQETENLYHRFKINNGVSKEEILKKKYSLKGVLVSKPLNWYLETLSDAGFEDVQVINSNLMFQTLYAKKR